MLFTWKLIVQRKRGIKGDITCNDKKVKEEGGRGNISTGEQAERVEDVGTATE